MRHSQTVRRFSVAASALCACVAVLTAPGFAAAGLVPQSESHELSGRASVNNGILFEQVVPGSTPNPTGRISAGAGAVAGPDAAASTHTQLDLSFNGSSISGNLNSDSRFTNNLSPSGLGDAHGAGTFNVTFSVTEATPFSLSGGIQGGGFAPVEDLGHARLTLSDADSVLLAFDSRDTAVPGSAFPFGAGGSLLPGHTYTLAGSIQTGVHTSEVGAGSNAIALFTLAVPEPTSLALLAPAAMLLLARHRR